MFVELLEFLRCPRPHEESPLIVAAARSAARRVTTGTLGCPVCRSEFGIVEGEAIIDREAPLALPGPPDADLAMRLAAFLQLTDTPPPGFVILHGGWGNHAEPLRAIVDIPLLLVNAAPGVDADAIVRCSGGLPLAAGVARGAALDAGVSGELAASIARSVRAGGRLVGPTSVPVPAGVRELVRDDRHWVAEKSAAPGQDPAPRLVPLKRAGP